MRTYKVDKVKKKRDILQALRTPRTRDELARMLNWLELNTCLADLTAEKKVYYNQTDGYYELWK